MFFRDKVSRLIIGFIFILGLSLNSLIAAEWDEQAIPVPVAAEQVKTEERMMQGSEFSFIYYTSNEDVAGIKDFYRYRLPNLGWKEKKLAEDLSQIKGFKMDASLKGVLGQNLIFEKDSDMLIINFLPAGAPGDSKTYFTLSQGKVEMGKELPEDINPAPELLTKPKKDVAPVYPGAALISLDEKESSLKATYFTKDDIEPVAAFYKAKMINYGWYLTNEKPLEKVESELAAGYDITKHCPSCAKEATTLAQSIETWWTELNFANQSQDTCNIVLYSVVNTQPESISLEMTTILVDYVQKR